MKDRIKKLALEAGYVKDNSGFKHWEMPEFRKFAELLIEECLYVASRTDEYDEDYAGWDMVEKHFELNSKQAWKLKCINHLWYG